MAGTLLLVEEDKNIGAAPKRFPRLEGHNFVLPKRSSKA
jgi:hypothetical protein